jgi:exopolysaccharide biosynthesis polyprenyl glycosylphosphotransferase
MASVSMRGGLPEGTIEDQSAPAPALSRVAETVKLRRDLVGVDVAALLIAWGWLPLAAAPADRLSALLIAAAAVMLTLLLLVWQRLYLARVCSVRSFEIVRLGRVTVVVVLTALVVGESDLAPGLDVGTLVGHALIALVLLATGRALFSSWLRVSRTEGRHVRNVALVGMNDEALALAHLLDDEPQLGYRVIGVACPVGDLPHDCTIPWLGPVTDATASLVSRGIGGVIVVVSAIDTAERNRLVRSFLEAGIHVQVSVGLERVDWRRFRALPLAHEPLFYIEPHRVPAWRLVVKRALDVGLGSLVFLLSAPIVAAAMLVILLTDGRPVLYRQVRVGKDGRPFTLLKLRTMCRDADARLEALRESNARNGPLFKMPADPRVTRVGRILRATSIDELPQLVNVLRGEMSLVGPRPALPEEVEQFDVELRARFHMRPGISGLWQVEARDNPSFRMYRHLDLFYLENWTLTLDLAILVATFELLVGLTVARGWNHLFRRRADAREQHAVSVPAEPWPAPARAPVPAATVEPAEPLTTIPSIAPMPPVPSMTSVAAEKSEI